MDIKAQTYGYSASAQNEGKTAFWFRVGAIVLMIIAVIILILPPLIAALRPEITMDTAFDWEKILYRIPTAFIVFVPAFYMASEANKHHHMRVESKRIELELTALTPFLESMEQAETMEIKKGLIGNYFIGHKRDTEGHADKKTQKWLERFVPNLIEKALNSVFDRLDSKDKEK